jgi:ATP-dependent exoDNAse (exonuclease V), alpha subunit - helicase superfamily I member
MEELCTKEGTVHSLIFQNPENGYTVLRLVTDEGELVTVVGCIPCAAPGERLSVDGVWETHPQHGEQLRAQEVERCLPETEEEIETYLASGICKGIGPATARRIVEKFGPDTLDILEREPQRLTGLKGMGTKVFLQTWVKVKENWRENANVVRNFGYKDE